MSRPGLALLTIVSLVLACAPAHADTWSAPEVRGDAVVSHVRPDPGPCATVEQGPTTRGDITALTVRHTRRDIVLRLEVSGLRGVQGVGAEFWVRTSRKDWTVTIDRFGAPPSVALGDAYDPDDVEVDECGYVTYSSPTYPCAGDTGTIAARAGHIEVSVPRRCLGSPGWVRVGAQVYGGRYRHPFSDTWAPRGSDDGDRITPVLGRKVFGGRGQATARVAA